VRVPLRDEEIDEFLSNLFGIHGPCGAVSPPAKEEARGKRQGYQRLAAFSRNDRGESGFERLQKDRRRNIKSHG
jgi:hypothetical protein